MPAATKNLKEVEGLSILSSNILAILQFVEWWAGKAAFT